MIGVVPRGQASASAILLASVVLLMVMDAPFAAQRPGVLPDLDTAALATGPYSRMHMLLEKTIFRVDVLTVEVRVDQTTRQRLAQLANGASGSGSRGSQIVTTVLAADHVLVTLEFVRNVAFERWLQGVRESLEAARVAGLIDEQTFRNVSASLPEWFHPMVGRGFAIGDRIIYRGYPDRMRTLVVSAAGDVLVDQTDQGATPRRAMLAGYLAPGTDFRAPLIESLQAR